MSKLFQHNGQPFSVGERVGCMVTWKNGHRVWTVGKLITIAGDEAFIETDAGAVSGDLETLEKQ